LFSEVKNKPEQNNISMKHEKFQQDKNLLQAQIILFYSVINVINFSNRLISLELVNYLNSRNTFINDVGFVKNENIKQSIA
jgi:hypothetical protein